MKVCNFNPTPTISRSNANNISMWSALTDNPDISM